MQTVLTDIVWSSCHLITCCWCWMCRSPTVSDQSFVQSVSHWERRGFWVQCGDHWSFPIILLYFVNIGSRFSSMARCKIKVIFLCISSIWEEIIHRLKYQYLWGTVLLYYISNMPKVNKLLIVMLTSNALLNDEHTFG